jgi:molecular chaperone GrpE
MDEEPKIEQDADQLAALQAELGRVRSDAEELRQMLESSQADFRNFKRRVEAERDAERGRANRELILRLLPLVDDFRRALAGAPRADAWTEGTGHILRKFEGVLEREGVRRIEALGQPFDPNRHEAIAEIERGDVPEGHVAEVAREGYLLGEQVLRPAQVVVARRPAIRLNRAPAPPPRAEARTRTRRIQPDDFYDNWILGGKRWPRY